MTTRRPGLLSHTVPGPDSAGAALAAGDDDATDGDGVVVIDAAERTGGLVVAVDVCGLLEQAADSMTVAARPAAAITAGIRREQVTSCTIAQVSASKP